VTKMLMKSNRFGDQEIEAAKIIQMPGGMLGFVEEKRFVLLTPPKLGPFCWLHAVDNPDLAFVVVDAKENFPDYTVQLTAEESRLLELDNPSEALFLLVVTMARDPSAITVNLQGPIVLNTARMLARQIVLEVGGYPTRQPFFPQKEKRSAQPEITQGP